MNEISVGIREDIEKFLKKRKIYFLVMLIILAISFGFEITNFTLSNDEELYINSSRDVLFWIGDGRFGITIINAILLVFGMFGPFISTFLAVMLLFTSAIIWCLCFEKVCQNQNIPTILYIIFSGFYCTVSLVIAEFMVFSTINIQMCLGMVFIALASYYIVMFIKENKSKRFCIIPIIFTFLAFSIYQGFTAYFISSASILVLLEVIQSKNIRIKEYSKLAFPYIGVFLTSIILYFIACNISYLIFPKRGYLSALSQGEHIIDVIKYVFKRFIYGGGGIEFLILKLTFFVLMVLAIMILFNKNGISRILTLFTMIVCVVSPYFVFIILSTTNIQFRALTGLLIYVGGVWFITIYYIYLYHSDWKKEVIYIISLILIFHQCQIINNLFYSDHTRYQHDLRIMGEIVQDIWDQHPNYTEKTLVFSGTMKMPSSNSIKRIQVIGMSIFEWENGNNGRIIPFINSMGYNFKVPTGEQIEEAKVVSEKLPSWPQKGSIIEKDDMIIVNLYH